MALICLTDYRLVFNRRREFGHITTGGSGYEGIGHQRALASELVSSAVYFYPPLPPLIASPASRLRDSLLRCFASPILRRYFYPFDSSCSRDWIHYDWEIRFIMIQRLDSLYLIDWIHYVWEIGFIMYERLDSLWLRYWIHYDSEIGFIMYERLDSLCMRDWIHYVWEIGFIMYERLDSLCMRDWNCLFNTMDLVL
jgi:hypothetical protein